MITYPLNNKTFSAEDAELYLCTRTSGVFEVDSFPITVSGVGTSVTIGEGIGWIRNSKFSGKVVANKESVSVDMGLADPSLPRWDTIVIRFDQVQNQSVIAVNKGVAASNPVIPAPKRTQALYELVLYKVYRKAGAASVTSGDVTDTRQDAELCGLMADGAHRSGEELKAYMLRSVYDKNGNGIVDNAEKVGGKSPDDFATKADAKAYAATFRYKNWSGGPTTWTQSASCPGMKAAYNTRAPYIHKTGTRKTDDAMQAVLTALNNGHMETVDGYIKATVYGSKPTADVTLYFHKE